LIYRVIASPAVAEIVGDGRRRRLPAASGSRSVDHAQHRADRELATDLQPWVELLPCPAVHANLTALAALPAPDEYAAAGSVQIALLKRERFADSQARAPEHNDEGAEPVASARSPIVRMTATISSTAGGPAGYCSPLVRAWAASVVARHGRRRTAVAGDIEQHGFP
jgi:hypothetical protein